MFEDEEETADKKEEPHEWSWINFWSLVIATVGGWFQYCGLALGGFSDAMDSHVEWKEKQKTFRRDVTYDLEKIPLVQDPGIRGVR
jgi:predicted alpha/beta hydrolase